MWVGFVCWNTLQPILLETHCDTLVNNAHEQAWCWLVAHLRARSTPPPPAAVPPPFAPPAPPAARHCRGPAAAARDAQARRAAAAAGRDTCGFRLDQTKMYARLLQDNPGKRQHPGNRPRQPISRENTLQMQCACGAIDLVSGSPCCRPDSPTPATPCANTPRPPPAGSLCMARATAAAVNGTTEALNP